MVRVHLVDYGMGNIGSVVAAFEFLGAKVVVSSDPAQIELASKLVLPGVGSFARAMQVLEVSGLTGAIKNAVLERGAPILGVCLGMQLLAAWGEEGGGSEGIGLVTYRVEPFPRVAPSHKALHIGFSPVYYEQPGVLYRGLESGTDFYFVHEYRIGLVGATGTATLGQSFHEEPFVASFELGHLFGVQFHPEKSQANGLLLLRNFLEA